MHSIVFFFGLCIPPGNALIPRAGFGGKRSATALLLNCHFLAGALILLPFPHGNGPLSLSRRNNDPGLHVTGSPSPVGNTALIVDGEALKPIAKRKNAGVWAETGMSSRPGRRQCSKDATPQRNAECLGAKCHVSLRIRNRIGLVGVLFG